MMRTRVGTRGYIAPEILHGKKYTHKADIFTAGIILFIMLSGGLFDSVAVFAF